MSEQLHLVDVPRALSPREEAVLAAITARPSGLLVEECGAAAHSVPGPRSDFTHPADTLCKWCPAEGRAITGRLVGLGLVRGRRGDPGLGTVYVLADPGAGSVPVRHGTEGRDGFDDQGFPVGY